MKRWTIYWSLPAFIYGLYNLDVDLRSRNSLSADGPPSACACGVSLNALFPQESRTFLSNQLCYNN
jgi:hypothetical protein